MRSPVASRYGRTLLTFTAITCLFAYLYLSESQGIQGIPLNALGLTSSTPCLDAINHQRKALLNTYRNTLAGITHVAIVDFPAHHNAGDGALWLGELSLLEVLGVETRYVCATALTDCSSEDLKAALSDVPSEKTAILFHGGGNFGDIWPTHQIIRNQMVREHPDRKIRSFPQTFEFDYDPPSPFLLETIEIWSKHADVDIVARDQESLELFQRFFPSTKTLLAPDIALFMGYNQDSKYTPPLMRRPGSSMSVFDLHGKHAASFPVDTTYHPSPINPLTWPRFSFHGPPDYDVMVIARRDSEGGQDHQDSDAWIPALQPHSVFIRDWGDDWNGIQSPAFAHSGEIDNGAGKMISFSAYWDQQAMLRVQWAMDLLARGKVIVSDRLHVEVMSTLLGLGHIAVEGGELRKVERLVDTWMEKCLISPEELEAIGRGEPRRTDANTVFVHNLADAASAVKLLLKGEEDGQRWSRTAD